MKPTKPDTPRCAICRHASAQQQFTGGSIYRCTQNDNIRVKANANCEKYSRKQTTEP